MRVSVIISNYNYACYLPAAIKSVLAQTYQDIEIIVVDDGSTDDSRSILIQHQQESPNQVKLLFQANQGQGAAFNNGFDIATGDIIAFLDADDTWKPNKIQRVVEILNEPNIVGIMHSLEVIDAANNVISKGVSKRPMPSGDIAKVMVSSGNACWFPPTSGLAYRRSALEKVLPMDIVKWRLCADGCLVYCTAFLGRIITLNEVLGSYRLHGKNNYFTRAQPTREQEVKSLAGIEMTNQYLNEFLEKIEYPKRIDLSCNLQYRRSKYYLQGRWDTTEMLEISSLILSWSFYSWLERTYYLIRFWLKGIIFFVHSNLFA
jgi:glycosyltransferase involved in cell wall biosynthesis